MPDTANFDVGVSWLDGVPQEIIDDFAKELEGCGVRTESERRAEEITAGIEWLLPTAVVVFLTHKYVGTLLQEAAKDHYPKIKSALLRLVQRTTGNNREVHIRNIVSACAPNKVDSIEAVVLSVMSSVATGHSIKFVFEHRLEGENAEKAVAKLFQLLIQNVVEFPDDVLTELIVQRTVRVHLPIVMYFDPDLGEWVLWSHSKY
jgi:hypothetical protein